MSGTRSRKTGGREEGPGVLFVVATPIGNLEDMTLRGLEVLKDADFVVAEDTRRTRGLFTRFGLSKELLSYHRFNERSRTPEILDRLRQGQRAALVTDAGTPGLSDPGGILAAACFEAGIAVVPVPGPTAVAAALSVSGFSADSFTFLGFPPIKEGRLKKLLESHGELTGPVVFFHPPRRVRDFLIKLREAWGNRRVLVARELTKLHEELMRGNLDDAMEHPVTTRELGEYTIVVEGAAPPGEPDLPAEELKELIEDGQVSLKDAVEAISARYGIRRSRVYEEALRIKRLIEGEGG